MYKTGYAYREASSEGATYIGLLALVYEALAADLLRAGQALLERRVQARCDASNHALLLLGHVETWAEELNDPTLAESLATFYGFLRKRILELQSSVESADFEKLSNLVLEVRSAWQKKNQQITSFNAEVRADTTLEASQYQENQHRTTWSA